MKVVNYFVRLFIIFFVLLIAKASSEDKSMSIENENINQTVNLTTMAMKVVEVQKSMKYSAKDTFTGDLTGYAYNCPLCSGKLACLPKYNITDGTNTYTDKDYGRVYIVASSKNLPCGSIVTFDSKRISDSKVTAIVLDRGVTGNALDFLAPSESYATKYIGRSSITYDVLRSGWGSN